MRSAAARADFRGAAIVVGYALRESMRRRVFLVVLALTIGFLTLYSFGTVHAFRDTRNFVPRDQHVVDVDAFAGATLLGLAMFATLFLGTVLATFLTLSTVRGDAERGLLQPLVVRPLGRSTLLLARFGGAAGVAGAYAVAVYLIAVAITGAVGGWWPDHLVGPAAGLAAGVAIVAAISVLGSVFLSATANGIAVFMVFGGGLTAGLLGQIGHAVNSGTLRSIARVGSWLLPFEGLYQAGLHALISRTPGLTGVLLQLGPFGSSQAAGPQLIGWSAAYLTGVLALAVATFGRRDL